MTFFAYMYQLKISFRKFFYSNKAIVPKEEQTKYALEVNENFQCNLKLKCKIAAKEIQSIKNFSHWPMTESIKSSESNAIVYLDISRNTHSITSHDYHNMVKVIDKPTLADKVVVIKKLP